MLIKSTSIIYMMVVLVFLGGCTFHHNRYECVHHCICRIGSNFTIYMLQNKLENIWHQQLTNKFVYIHQYNDKNCDSYHSDKYIVKPGDTLYYIAWITGSNYLDLAIYNNIKNIDMLRVGQVLTIKNKKKKLYFLNFSKKICLYLKERFYNINRMVFYFNKASLLTCLNKNVPVEVCDNRFNNVVFHHSNISSKLVTFNHWGWPTNGKVINTFSDTERGNKGIDISGIFGQPILAATDGKVVYVGNILQGYGNLIIIRHSDNYFSAYAHNDTVLVTEQQHVKIGDKIATMGNTGTDKVKLHFEIRYKGKSVDPLRFLPKFNFIQ